MGLTGSVLGASGYAGAELVRLLLGHPAIALEAVGGHDSAGSKLGDRSPGLAGAGDMDLLALESAAGADTDVCFSCLPAGVLDALSEPPAASRVVDLADDHRSDWTYALTEWARDTISGEDRVANPGCYPTATLLGLLPFARAGVIEGPVIVDALSGASGAGRRSDDGYQFASLHSTAHAYGSGTHRHVPEIERGLATLGGLTTKVSFTPHLVPMARGLLVTARATPLGSLTNAESLDLLHAAYDHEPFVHVTSTWPSTKDVYASNAAHVTARVDERAGLLICSVAIDNLGKGAAGQALQNANLMLGLPETAGLTALGVSP